MRQNGYILGFVHISNWNRLLNPKSMQTLIPNLNTQPSTLTLNPVPQPPDPKPLNPKHVFVVYP